MMSYGFVVSPSLGFTMFNPFLHSWTYHLFMTRFPPTLLVLLALHILLMQHRDVLLLEPSQVIDHENNLVRNPEREGLL